MNKERLQQIKDSIDLQLTVAKSVGTRDEIAEEEKELYDEVVRLGNAINELEKWLKEYSEKDTMSSIIFGVVLNHLIDLKGEKNEKD